MRVAIRRFYSPDVQDLETFTPQEADCFCILLQLIVGPEDSEGEESFDILICTPKYLLTKVHRGDILVGRHHLIVGEFNFEQITEFLKSYCANYDAPSWRAIACKLSRIGKWEFEDYKDENRTGVKAEWH